MALKPLYVLVFIDLPFIFAESDFVHSYQRHKTDSK